MKPWRRYADYLSEGEWHIHTSYTDGKNTVREYCQKAVAAGIPLLAFTEHVREHLDYNFQDFLRDVAQARKEFDLIILSGCETKVLPGGKLDVAESVLSAVDYAIFAFHSFPGDRGLLLDSLQAVLTNKYISAWAHPGSIQRYPGFTLPEPKLDRVFKLMGEHDVLLEINRARCAIPDHWLPLLTKYRIRFVKGSDVHSLEDLGRYPYHLK